MVWKDAVLQVDFFDAAGKRIDVGQARQSGLLLPAGETNSFKASFRREFPETNYVKHVVRVVSAKENRAEW